MSGPGAIHGYRSQPPGNVELVNENKIAEEIVLRTIDRLMDSPIHDKRWLTIARSHIEQGFMALNRAIMQPQRVDPGLGSGAK